MADTAKQKDVSQERISTRGSILEGVVVSDKMQKTVTVRTEYIVKVPKYDRMKRRHTKIKARNPPEINAKAGDFVKLAECRPLSKTVHFIIIEKSETKK
jgi:small subunit ribosomal protein S17